MLGYNSNDVYRMMAGIKIALAYIPSNSSNDEVRDELHNAYNLLDGLIVEGHVM